MRILTGLFTLGLFAGPAYAQQITLVREQIRECEMATVKFSDFPVTATAKGNWLQIIDAELPDNAQQYRFIYLPLAASGRVQLPTKGLIPFKPYEIRAYLDWEGTHSFKVVSRLDFGVTPNRSCPRAMINSVAGTVEAGSPLQFAFTGVVDSATNWVSIAKPNEVNYKFLKSTYLPRLKEGDATIDTTGIPPGDYELRLFEDWANHKEYFIQSRVNFTVR